MPELSQSVASYLIQRLYDHGVRHIFGVAKAFRIYWDAGYQIHIHVNGDAGIDMVLDNLEANMRHHPRYDQKHLLNLKPIGIPSSSVRHLANGNLRLQVFLR
jgi:hypothetical protein